MSIEIDFIGLVRLRTKFENMPEGMKTRAMKELSATGLKIQASTKRRCPVDTGRLRSSYFFRRMPSQLAVKVGTNVHYAPHVEFGTTRQRAQPHLLPSVEEHADDHNARMKSALARTLG